MHQHPEIEQILVTATRFSHPGPDGKHPLPELIENRHWGWLLVGNSHQDVLYCTPGATQTATFFRSAAKPFQALPLVEAGYHTLLTQEELAIACASHTGSPQHLRLVRSILAKADFPESALQCGPHMPIDSESQAKLTQKQQPPTAIYNNCSGKHAGMLFYCRQAGLDPATYLEPSHPLQQRILAGLKHWGDMSDIPTAVDGCGAPVFYLPLHRMALLFARLGSTPELAPIQEAMIAHPAIIGGEGRVDTVIMQVSQGKLLAKVGADGVLCVSRIGQHEGLALKIADGATDIRNLALVEILIRLGWLDKGAANTPELAPYRNLQRSNTQEKSIGEYVVHFNPDTTRHA